MGEIKVSEELTEDDDNNKEHGEPKERETPAKDWEAGGFPVFALPWFGLRREIAKELTIDMEVTLWSGGSTVAFRDFSRRNADGTTEFCREGGRLFHPVLLVPLEFFHPSFAPF